MKKIIILFLLITPLLCGFGEPTPSTPNSDPVSQPEQNNTSKPPDGEVIKQNDPYAYAGEKTADQLLIEQAQQQYSGPRLSSLSVEGIALIPVFSRETFSYAAYLPDGQNSVTVSARAASGSVYIDGAAGSTRRITLSGEEKTVRVIVTEGSLSTTYTILLLRTPDLSEQPASGIARITHIRVSSGAVTEERELSEADGSDIAISLPAGLGNKYTVSVTVNRETAVYFNNVRIYNGFEQSKGAWLWTRQDIDAALDDTLLGVHLVDAKTRAALNYYTFRLTRTKASLRIELQVGNDQALVNGKVHDLDAPPQIEAGHTMVPLRFIAEGLGATVSWDASERRVDIKQGNQTLQLFIGKQTEGLPAPPFIEKGYTMVPLRYVSEQLACMVEWLAETREIIITR